MTTRSAIILAGGKSSRMGTPKALLPFDGEPLIVHVAGMLQQMFDDVVIVAAPEQELPSLAVTLVRDEVAHQGPVGGICYGLRAARGEIAFVTSCDSAFLNGRLIEHLLEQIDACDVVVPHWQDRFQPLHAVYRRSVLPLLEQQLARGELRPIFLFDKVRTCRIAEEEIRRFDPDGSSFFNMNTPEDYAEALRRWRRSISCTVELFGVARLVTNTDRISLELPRDSTYAQLFAALAERLPALVGRVITADRPRLIEGYACNVNGREFVRSPETTVNDGDNIAILSADAGG
jgi:molybdopterin-guanine dinucleotide biosynthesis protein A